MQKLTFGKEHIVVLQKLKKAQVVTRPNHLITYTIENFFKQSKKTASKKVRNEVEVIYDLTDMGAVNLVERTPSPHDWIGHIEILHPKFDELLQYTVEETSSLPVIDYQSSGIGYVNDKKFKFSRKGKVGRLFADLFMNLNKAVPRDRVLERIKFYEDGEEADGTRNAEENIAISSILGEIRKRTGLTAEELSNTGGNVTLVGKKYS